MIRASLAELDLGELLKALSVGRKSAVVSFQGWIYGRVHLLGGRILYARTEPGPHLGEYLVRLGHLSLEEVQTLVERQDRENPGTPLGALALELGLIGEEELLEALKAQVLEALATLLGEKEGEVLAEPLEEGSQVALPQTLDTDWALMEAARRLDEWRRGQVDPDEVLHLVEDPTRHPLSPEAWTVLELLDGVRRARSVALLSGLPEEEVYYLLHELKSRGLVRPSTLLAEDPLILVLAESGVVRRLLLYLLEAHRFRVLLAKDQEGLLRLLKERPKGVILQGERALEAARRVRATLEGRLASIYLVSDTPPGLLARPLRLLHLPKPLRAQEVLKALEPLRQGAR
jgi:CheY-like chemotaxis protein